MCPRCLSAACLQRHQYRAVGAECYLSFIDMKKKLVSFSSAVASATCWLTLKPHTHSDHRKRGGGESWLPVSLCVSAWLPSLSCWSALYPYSSPPPQCPHSTPRRQQKHVLTDQTENQYLLIWVLTYHLQLVIDLSCDCLFFCSFKIFGGVKCGCN